MTLLKRVQAWWLAHRARPATVARSVFCDESGISQFDWLGDREVGVRFRWDEVAGAFAYKLDCYGFDRICVALSDSEGEICIDVSEDDAGYEALIGALPRYLPGCLSVDEWFEQVAVPAFATQWTVLYRKHAGTP